MRVLAILIAFMFTLPAYASFQAFTGTRDLKIFNKIKCGPGLTCSREKDKLLMDAGQHPQISSGTMTLTEDQCGSTIIGLGHTVTLPDASGVPGCRFTFSSSVAASGTNYVDVSASDIISQLTNAAGDRVSNATSGNSLTLEAVGNDAWHPISVYGTWSDAN